MGNLPAVSDFASASWYLGIITLMFRLGAHEALRQGGTGMSEDLAY
jgi:hypothetical protein